MPLGNLTSQFFANVYLNELDQFVKHQLKAEFYIRYVDDFVILHPEKETLEHFKEEIQSFLKTICLNLHPDKSKIILLERGVTFLGYKIFPHHKILRKSNMRKFRRNFFEKTLLAKHDDQLYDDLLNELHGWLEYAKWADTYKLRKRILENIQKEFTHRIPIRDIDRWIIYRKNG